ncbi:MAG: hypothetical protein HFK03_06270 [Clostridia bacterium]|nr:hypothetical protein [Clostridia bacterium]
MEDIIKSITEAEQQAAEIRLKAGERAAEIIAAASARAAEIAQRTEAECKIMREVQINRAVEDAQSAYDKAVAESATAAKKYADAVLKTADGAVNEILGRITGGNR